MWMWIHNFFRINFHAFIFGRMWMDVKRLWFSMTKWMNEWIQNMLIYRFHLIVIFSCLYYTCEYLLVFLLLRQTERCSRISNHENHVQHLIHWKFSFPWVYSWVTFRLSKVYICFMSLHLFCIILNNWNVPFISSSWCNASKFIVSNSNKTQTQFEFFWMKLYFFIVFCFFSIDSECCQFY